MAIYLERGYTESFLREAARNMYDAIWRDYERLRPKVDEGSLSPKEFGKILDYTSASALKDYLVKEGFYPKVYSEEWFRDYKARDNDVILIVDPIDGTSNFSRGIRYSAVSIAVSNGGTLDDVYSGYVLNLFTGEEYFAYKGFGSFKDKAKIRVKPTLKTIDAFVSIALTHEIPGKSRSLEILKYTNYPRHLGSAALEDCLVAEGVLDLHIDLRNSLRIYDIAASQLIVREAGGRVWLNQSGSKTVYLDKVGGVNIISSATPHLLEKAFDIMRI